MNKKLSELFDLPDTENVQKEDESSQFEDEKLSPDLITQETMSTIEKVEQALPAIKGLDASDGDLDELSDLAKDAYTSLMDLGMQVDSRFSAEIFNSASSMLGHAINAKTVKINKKLKMIQLQLQKAELERKLSVQAERAPEAKTPLGEATVIDRNELIRQVLEQSKSANKDK